nr:DEAD/DEAH box helicase [Enterocloster clostridioformis]
MARIRNTDFPILYKKFILDCEITKLELKKILTIATIFLNSTNQNIQNLGYRIILIFCNRTKDYRPLYEVAMNLGYIPVARSIDLLHTEESFFHVFNSAFIENFHKGQVYMSEQQYELDNFFTSKNFETVSVIAPTSYGKTELILSLLKKNIGKKICIVTPTKSLLAQTKIRIINSKIDWIKKVVIQPEMYNGTEENLVAVLTQERLLRLLKMQPELYFDFIVIDEAHGLLNDDTRSRLLAEVILILEKRNPEVALKFLTPFLGDSDNLRIKFMDINISEYKVSEYIKTERFYIYDERETKKLKFYDQFLDDFYDLGYQQDNTYEFIKKTSGENNIIYLNKPKDIENFSNKFIKFMPSFFNKKIEKICDNLKEFIHPQYQLLDCIKSGFIYHHGSVPDSVRIYIEHAFSVCSEIKYVVTSSTLLEGVNLPADKLYILDNRKGLGYLSPSNFKNLIGRVCRFSEIFKEEPKLKKLEPEIYLVISEFFRNRAQVEKYLQKTMKVDKTVSDELENILLRNTEMNQKQTEELNKEKEFIENYEEGTLVEFDGRKTQTMIGKACFANNITELDIFKSEHVMQKKINYLKGNEIIIRTTENLFQVLYQVFFKYIEDNDKNQNLRRFQYQETRNFYNMFLNWRIRGASYSEMIASFMGHWDNLIKNHGDTLVYVDRWGDQTRGGIRELWTDIRKKSHKEKINLAIVRIKEEQDFLDNTVIKYIEVLNDLHLLDEVLYLKIKYGTDDKLKVLLVKNGLSLGLANLVADQYSRYLKINYANNTVKYKDEIIEKMQENDENEVLIYEMQYFIEK